MNFHHYIEEEPDGIIYAETTIHHRRTFGLVENDFELICYASSLLMPALYIDHVARGFSEDGADGFINRMRNDIKGGKPAWFKITIYKNKWFQ